MLQSGFMTQSFSQNKGIIYQLLFDVYAKNHP